jgi:general secretion pathway protein D
MKYATSILIILLISALQLFADYNNYTLKDFANVVASQNKINIVIDEKLDQKFDFVITKPIKAYTNLDVFTELLDKYGLELQYRKTYYIIIRKIDKKVDKMMIFKTKHIDAKKAAKKINPILTSFYKTKKDPKNNNTQNLNTQNLNKQNAVPIQNNDTNQSKPKYKNFSLNAVDHNHLVLTYKDDKIQKYTQLILNSMDHIKNQLTVECQIFEVKTGALEKKGVQMQALGQTVDKALNLKLQIAGSALPIISSTTDRLRFDSLISLLNDKTDSNLLATPKVTILEGKEAELKEGETYPITTQENTTTNSSTTNVTKKTTYIDIGLQFKINYEYEQDNYNYLKIVLDKKDLLSYDPVNQSIITTTRNIHTNIRIVPGQTIIIAGVGRNSIQKKNIAVPYLSQIPLLGELLKYKYKEHKKTTLVITIRITQAKKNFIQIRKLHAKL